MFDFKTWRGRVMFCILPLMLVYLGEHLRFDGSIWDLLNIASFGVGLYLFASLIDWLGDLTDQIRHITQKKQLPHRVITGESAAAAIRAEKGLISAPGFCSHCAMDLAPYQLHCPICHTDHYF